MPRSIKIIDLFAGPGGLGEGFSAFESEGISPFKIVLSVEKEKSAHRTLTLRSLFRQFPSGSVPEAYYAFMRGELKEHPEDELYLLPEIRDELEAARREALQFELGRNSQSKLYRLIRERLAGDDFVLIGGPPCQAYSLVGRSRNYGDRSKEYVAEDDHRNFLYREYLRLIAKFQPSVFVMENVKGMISARVGGQPIIGKIFEDLQDPCKALKTKPEPGVKRSRYRVCSFVASPPADNLFGEYADLGQSNTTLNPSDYIIRSEEFGIPQTRHRVILFGIREDVGEQISWNIPMLKPDSEKATVSDVISDLPRLRSRISRGSAKGKERLHGHDEETEWLDAIKRVRVDYLKTFASDGVVDEQVLWGIRSAVNLIGSESLNTGANFGGLRSDNIKFKSSLAQWYLDSNLGRSITNHQARGHMPHDLIRYFYYSIYASELGKSPTSRNLPEILWPNHGNFHSGKFADRFKVQLKNSPASTITSHISKDGHYYIHYDFLQCRSLTVREAARIQTFPDNYHFVGNRTEQYVQVGNAVPPFLARQLAEVVNSVITR